MPSTFGTTIPADPAERARRLHRRQHEVTGERSTDDRHRPRNTRRGSQRPRAPRAAAAADRHPPLHRARLVARPLDDAARRLRRDRAHLPDPLGGPLGSDLVQRPARHGRDRDVPDRLPDRDRRLRLLGLLLLGQADEARGPLGARRASLAGLLPSQHRPQGDRGPVPGHDDDLLRHRRVPGDDLPRRARAAGRPVLQPADLQRARLRARGADDLHVRRAGLRRPRELRDPADDRLRRHGVPAAERALVLAAPDRRRDHARRPGHARRRPVGGLDVLRAALLAPAARAGVLQHGRAVGGAARS